MSEAPTGDLKPDPVAGDPPPADPVLTNDTPPAGDPPPAPPAGDPPPAEGAAKEQPAPTWPDDWREQLAGGDEAFLRQLKRYSSPSTFAKGWKEREDLIRSGKVKRDAPDPSDAKAMAEWRKEQGLPDDATGYKPPEIKGAEWTDADKPILAQFFEHAHKENLPQSAVNSALTFYKQLEQQAEQARAEADRAALDGAEDALIREWGGEFKSNLVMAKRFVSEVPGVGENWSEYRGPDGRRLGDNVEFVKWAADAARQRFGDVTFASGDTERRHSSELESIENIMKTDIDRYWSEGLNKRHMELKAIEAKRPR
jgi:hypothetical protein